MSRRPHAGRHALQRATSAASRHSAARASSTSGDDQVVGLDEHFRPITASIDELDAVSTLPQCPVCLMKSSSLILHPCRHSICNKCLDGWMRAAAKRADDGASACTPPCPMCRAPITGWHESEAGERGAADAPLETDAEPGQPRRRGTSARLRIVV